jgi:hypothetical protein
MPAGCEFICKNKECKHFNFGFVVTDAWPLTRIELVIGQNQIKINENFKKKLVEFKNEGRKYFKIQYPDDNHVPRLGYLINKWCPKCSIVWSFEALNKNDGDNLENCLKNSNIPVNCEKCSTLLIHFSDLIKDGIKCSECQKDLEQNRWFSNER